MGLTDFEPTDFAVGDPHVAVAGDKARRQLPESTRRILFIILGVLVLAVSVAGFYLTSDAFDKRKPVLVAAIDIQKGDTVTAGHFTSEMATLGSIPHIPYTPDAPYAFEGFIATQPIPVGTVVLGTMMIPPNTQPTGNQLDLTVQFDTSLVTNPVFDGDTVLVVDPGREPTPEDQGRAQRALYALTLRNYQDGSMTMFLEPEQWAEWRDLPVNLGALPQILPVPIGGVPDEFAMQINEVWRAEWEAKAAAAAEPTADAGPQAGPGELEVVVAIDSSLVPSGVSEGDTVFLIDPGVLPTTENLGRPRQVLETIELENFDGSAIRLYVPPSEWIKWQALPDDLGASGVALLVAEDDKSVVHGHMEPGQHVHS